MLPSRLFLSFFVLLAFAALPMPLRADDPSIGKEKGEVYPDFLLPRLNGETGRLSDYRGKKVLLIHFASW